MDALTVANILVEVLIAVASAVGNSIVLILIFRHGRLRTITNAFIANLAAADLMVGILGLPSVLLTVVGLPRNYYGCLLMTCMIIICTQVSIFSLLTVAIDRFVAIKYPFFYNAYMTPQTVAVVSSMNWCLGILVGLVPVFGWNKGWNEQNRCAFELIIDFNYRVYFNFFGFILTPLIIMFFIYLYIFHVARKQLRQIASLQVESLDNRVNDQSKNMKKELKAAKKFAVVIGLFAMCWIPLDTMNTISLWYGKICIPCITVAVWFSHVNSAINPFIYAYGNTPMRKAFLQDMCCKQPNDIGTESTYAE